MIGTIVLGSCVSMQGVIIAQRNDGKVVIRVGERTFVGLPVKRSAA